MEDLEQNNLGAKNKHSLNPSLGIDPQDFD